MVVAGQSHNQYEDYSNYYNMTAAKHTHGTSSFQQLRLVVANSGSEAHLQHGELGDHCQCNIILEI